MRKPILLLGLLAVAVLALVVRAEKASMTPAQLLKSSTHTIVGTVKAIYKRTAPQGNWYYTHYLAEVKIDKAEKGEGLKPGGLVYVRYWHREWRKRGTPPPSTSGHRGLPKEGETLRIYLARNAYDGFTPAAGNNDGGYNVIGANGFERLPKGN